MPKPYELKKDYSSPSKVNAIIKSVKDKSKEDREKALKLFEDLRAEATDIGIDPDTRANAQKTCVDCLKLAQMSKESEIKLITLILKLKDRGFGKEGEETPGDKDKEKTPRFFGDLDDDE